jgi:hypothetical protein
MPLSWKGNTPFHPGSRAQTPLKKNNTWRWPTSNKMHNGPARLEHHHHLTSLNTNNHYLYVEPASPMGAGNWRPCIPCKNKSTYGHNLSKTSEVTLQYLRPQIHNNYQYYNYKIALGSTSWLLSEELMILQYNFVIALLEEIGDILMFIWFKNSLSQM